MSYQSLSHSTWDCMYHIVCIPKYRKKKLYGHIRKFLGPVFHELAGQKCGQIFEGHLCQDHGPMLIKIPPKDAVSNIIRSNKGNSAIAGARQFGGRKRNVGGEKFWARGYAGSTVGFEEDAVRNYIRRQKDFDKKGDDDVQRDDEEKNSESNSDGRF